MIRWPSWRDRGTLLWAAATTGVLAVAIFLGWRSGQARDMAGATAALTIWDLPQPVAENPERDAAILRARRPWGGAGAFHDGDPVPTAVAQPWTLVGTVLRDDQRYALIRAGPPTAKIEYRGVGEKLPDGSTVDKVDADGIATVGGAHPGPTLYRLFDRKIVSQ